MKLKLTKKNIDSIDPSEKQKKYYDTELHGYFLVCNPSGRKTFFIEYGKSRKKLKIGVYGLITPEQARSEAKEKLVSASRGNINISRITVSQWIDTYINEYVTRKKNQHSDKIYLSKLKQNCGTQLLSQINTDMINSIIKEYASTGKKTSANRCLASIKTCIQVAWRKGLIENNPAMRIKPYPENSPRSRTLTDEEMERLQTAIDGLKDQFVRVAFRVLIETGARLREVLTMRWEDIDLQNALWRIPRNKSGKPQVIPLAHRTIELLKGLPNISPFVFPGKDIAKPRNSLKRAWATLQKAATIPDVHIHDLRRTFGLRIAMRSGLHIASKLLRHSDIRITERHYAPLEIEELRKALEE